MRRGEVGRDSFSHGESAAVSPSVSLPNRNPMNLLEYPALFYAACLTLQAIDAVDGLAIRLACLRRAARHALDGTYWL